MSFRGRFKSRGVKRHSSFRHGKGRGKRIRSYTIPRGGVRI